MGRVSVCPLFLRRNSWDLLLLGRIGWRQWAGFVSRPNSLISDLSNNSSIQYIDSVNSNFRARFALLAGEVAITDWDSICNACHYYVLFWESWCVICSRSIYVSRILDVLIVRDFLPSCGSPAFHLLLQRAAENDVIRNSCMWIHMCYLLTSYPALFRRHDGFGPIFAVDRVGASFWCTRWGWIPNSGLLNLAPRNKIYPSVMWCKVCFDILNRLWRD